MKNIALLISLLTAASFNTLNGQDIVGQVQVLDTIYANEQKNVALFFPDPIRQGITGSENFVFTYNREKEQHLGLLQATPGVESNLLVISNTGSVFSYIVKYSEKLDKLNFFIPDSVRIGKVAPDPVLQDEEIEEVVSESKSENLLADKISQYQNFSRHLLRNYQEIGNIKKQQEGIILRLENIAFYDETLYFEIEIENNSSINYEPDFLTISVETKKQGKKKSLQKLVQEPILKYQMPEKIIRGSSASFVYVLPKFSIADDKQVVIDLNERNGERDIKLKVKKKYINNPN